MTMSYKQALKIIRLDKLGQHEYIARCPVCGTERRMGTDAPVDLIIEMAEIHKTCKEKENVESRIR